jgi:DNA-binding NtrC family response regulator
MNSKKKLLVIDDEPIILEGVRRILEPGSYHVETFASGLAALERIKQETFDLVITDLKMPGMSGLEVLKEIKESQPDLPVIFITGYTSVDGAVEVMKLGAVDYIAKPFTPEEMLSTVKRALEQRVVALEDLYLRKELMGTNGFDQFVGKSQDLITPEDLEVNQGSKEIYADLHSRRNRRADDLKFNDLRDYTSEPLCVEDLNDIKRQLREHVAENVEKVFVISALQRHRGNVTRASEETGMLRPKFQAMMKKIGISSRDYAEL